MIFRVVGIPAAQPRTKSFRKKNGGVGHYTPGTAVLWREQVAWAAKQAKVPKHEGPVRVSITFLFPRPKKLQAKKYGDERIPHTVKPDRDNLDKAVLDELTLIGVLKDDKSVCGGSIYKWWVAQGEEPGAIISIEPV
jgi:Holliday junction resolvase RusA-like endonuclease